MLLQLVNFLFAMKLSSDYFYKVQISTNYKKIILKFLTRLAKGNVSFCPLTFVVR